MNDDFLRQKLRRVVRRYQWVGLWRKLAIWWSVAAAAVLVALLLQRQLGWTSPHVIPVIATIALGGALGLALHHFSRPPDLRWVAGQIERAHPELDGILLTAIQQADAGEGNYLQYRVIQEATSRSQDSDWRGIVPASQMAIAQIAHLVALGCLVFALTSLRMPAIHGAAPAWVGADGVSVTPGNASIERGDSLVVLARFGGALPPSVNLVVRESGATPRQIPLVKSLADPVFGGSVADVAQDFFYHLEYRGRQTREFKVTVFEHPRLVRSDVALTFPDYTKLPRKEIPDTRRVSAVEGTTLDFTLQLNKPVTSARLVARDAAKTEVPLAVTPGQPVATLAGFRPAQSQAYDLQLIDAEGRANKIATSFVIDVQPNRAPEVRVASPRGDVRPSPLEEVSFEGTVWDDFGAAVYGLSYSVGGGAPQSIELGRGLAAREKREFSHLLRLEELDVSPDDLIAWHAWAEDVGPDGSVRRTNGDLYFAEVRPFDEIFRESQDMQSGEPPPGGGGGSEARRLTDVQKQIISATWRLQREGATPGYSEDVKVVTDAQKQALAQAGEAAAEARAPRAQAMWRTATAEMEQALDRLEAAARAPGPLAEALPAEQAAYQALLKLQAHETAVTRNQRQQGGGGGGGGNQRQIDQLDLKQAENRYETQRQARAPQNQERREQLAVMNRLQELARRQNDLNERMRELQTALQEARTEEEREEVRRRLKRLHEEQRQMLADVDEVRQRMDRAENQSSMSQERQQLDQTREDVQQAADAAGEGAVAQALASGTRAQRQLQDLRDEMRKQNSSQFAEDMRDMRNQARQLASEQEAINEKLEGLASGPTQRKSLSDGSASEEMIQQLEQQRQRMSELMDRATEVSEQAENTEPLLSRQLYDSIRKVSQSDANSIREAREDLLAAGQLTYDLRDRLQRAEEREGSGKALEVTREMLRDGAVSQAQRGAGRAREEIEELKRGVERAAESVLGDELEQLRLAQSELDELTEQLEREVAQADGSRQRSGNGATSPDGQAAGQESGDGQPSESQRRAEELRRAIDGLAANSNDPTDPRTAGRDGNGEPGEPGGRQGLARAGQAGQDDRGQPGAGESTDSSQPTDGQESSDERMAGNPTSQSAGQSGEGEQQGRQPGQEQRGQSGQGGAGEAGGQEGDRLAGEPQDQGSRGGSQRGGGRGGFDVNDFFTGGDGRGGSFGGWDGSWDGRSRGPLTGEEFDRWAERLRDVEELLETPDLRSSVASARERARLMRRDFRQDLKKPDWAVVRMEVLKPLVEVRGHVADELARRSSKDSLAPIDRDPVPHRFAESVRRYYEELGKDP